MRYPGVLMLAAVAGLVGASAAPAMTGRHTSAPSNSSLPSIVGSTHPGDTVTANTGTWTGSAPISFQYQWRICGGNGGSCHDIAGATGPTYQIKSADLGNTLRVHVIASNPDGSASATSNASAKIAAASNAPSNISKPTISGDPSPGSTLTAGVGGWSGASPITFQYQWLVCGGNGGSCHDIAGATTSTYQVKSGDAGNTLRVRVAASNASGSASATSDPSAKVGSAPAPPATGCPKLAAGAQAVSVADVGPPARLQIDQFVPSGAITSHLTSLSVRFHVSDSCGQSVSGASVYATALPYRQVTVPSEVITDGSGWATLTFNRLSGFPASRNQQLMVMFVRARKPGESPLGGITGTRLISLRVNLRK